MKKIAALLLSGLMVLGLTACGNSQSKGTTSNSMTNSATKETTAQTENGNTENLDNSITDTDSIDTGNKILVVYYSASGNTKRVANNIADTLNADTLELVPQKTYSSEDLDWTKKGSRVNKEHDDESLRNIELVRDTVENWNEYSTVFIAYPIWWGIAAWPVNQFVTNNDFTGKTVIPVATSASSGMGQSGTLLKEMAGTGDWQDGQRFSSGVSEDEVANWAKGLGL